MALATPISGVFLGWLGEQKNGLTRPKNEGETPKAFGIKAALGRSFTGVNERGQSGKARLTHSFGNPLLLPRASLRCRMRHLAFLLTLTIPLSICTNLFAQKSQNSTNSSVEANFAGSAQKTFLDAQTHYKHNPTNAEVAWRFAQATFDWAEYATNSAQRAELAEKGIAASRKAVAGAPHSVAGHYYLGMNLGQLARTKSLGALKLVGQMEHEFTIARDLDEHFDHAGPDRNLGLLYRDAPALGSIGSRTKARQHLQRAVELAPDFPENRLNLIEADLKWGDRNGARNELKVLEAVWAGARTNLTGAAWAPSWADWETRLSKVKKKLEEPQKTAPRRKE